MATASTVKILLRCLRSGCNYASDILSLDWVEMDLKLDLSINIHSAHSKHRNLEFYNLRVYKPS